MCRKPEEDLPQTSESPLEKIRGIFSPFRFNSSQTTTPRCQGLPTCGTPTQPCYTRVQTQKWASEHTPSAKKSFVESPARLPNPLLFPERQGARGGPLLSGRQLTPGAPLAPAAHRGHSSCRRAAWHPCRPHRPCCVSTLGTPALEGAASCRNIKHPALPSSLPPLPSAPPGSGQEAGSGPGGPTTEQHLDLNTYRRQWRGS